LERNGLSARDFRKVEETREMAKSLVRDGLESANLIKSDRNYTYKSSQILMTAQPNLLMRDRSTLKAIGQLNKSHQSKSMVRLPPSRQTQPTMLVPLTPEKQV
jgi:hypothetical protein